MSNRFQDIKDYLRAANYLTAAQIFLQDNFLLDRELCFDDIKPRLLGHWGSGPGVNFAYAHLSKLIKKYNGNMMFVLGPGHAFPALQANLFLEGTLALYYPEAKHNYEGISYICRNFSWPYGFPSHSNPSTPGVILEGGELGYSLSTSFGAVLDNPDLTVVCLIGDGEAETGPLAASWHLNKIVDPKTNGIVLPILHLNGYKISGPTIFGRMSDEELTSLFKGYGYNPIIVDGNDDEIHEKMNDALEYAHNCICEIKNSPRLNCPQLPMIIMRTKKGWTGIKELNGQKIEGNALSHQVVLSNAKSDTSELHILNEWLSSYKFADLFHSNGGLGNIANEIMPLDNAKRMGATKYCLGGDYTFKPLKLPPIEQFAEDSSKAGTFGSSSMRRAGLYLNEVFKLNKQTSNFRLMSPDETYSNKLDAVFETTKRSWVWPIESWDRDMSYDGRVMEMLSEHNLQGLAQGYILTGRHAVLASYEAFVQVVVSMMDQYAKFLHHANEISWRGPIPSLTYILTSSAWRQDHNGFSHQNPGFIDDVLRRQGHFVNVYFPPDGNSTLAVLEEVLSSTNKINVVVGAKTVEPRWLTPAKARQAIKSGLMIWEFASDDNPDIVISAAGDYMTNEALASIDIIKSDRPDINIRFVNILSLSACGLGSSKSCLSKMDFEHLFTNDKPVVINFHGYPETIKSIIFDYTENVGRFDIHGYIENGSTTTPFDMHVRNKTSRFDLAISILNKLVEFGRLEQHETEKLVDNYHDKLNQNTGYSRKYGVDLPEIDGWRWNR